MVNQNYQRGRSFEYRCKKYLESQGYLVFRSAGSHSLADLIAFKDMQNKPREIFNTEKPMLIQCKYGSAKMTNKEIDDLYILCYDYGLNPVIATINKKKRLKFNLIVQGKIGIELFNKED